MYSKYFICDNHRCKIIFPSSHVVFESINEVKNDIDEKEKHVQDYP